MERGNPWWVPAALLVGVVLLLGSSPSEAQIQQSSRVLANGHMAAAGGSYSIEGTLGQVSPGEMAAAHRAEFGFWYTILFQRTTGVGPNEVPHRFEYELFQNRPNPFNPRTTISFSLASPGRVTLNLYDVRGRRVANLLSRHYEAGAHEYVFNPTNLASGVYIYRLQAGEFVATRSMLLLK